MISAPFLAEFFICGVMGRFDMDSLSMEKAMIRNMVEKTGKSLEDWIKLVKNSNFSKHGEIVMYLKKQIIY